MTDDVLDTRGGRVLVSVAAGVAGLAGSYAVTGNAPAFLASPVERTLARTLPGAIVSFAITTLGSLGQQLNLLTAVVVAGLFVALSARAAILAGDAANNRLLPSVGTAVVTWAVAVALTGEPVLSAGAALPAAGVVVLAQALDAAGGHTTPISSKRRRALSTVGVALGASVLGYRLGGQRTPTATAADAPTLAAPGADLDDAQTKLDAASDRSLDVDDLDSLVSETFFEVDINSIDPQVDAGEWTLSVTGAVEQEVTLDYDELQGMPAENRFSTLRCVGDSLNGKKMDTALWTGVPVDQLLDEAGIQSGCECVMLRATDGYYEEFPIEALRGGLLVYGMNGKVLPRGHGYPVRALVPGHWGEVNVKWLTEIEVLEREAEGYWEQRGWQGTGPVKPVAKLHHAELLDDGRRRLAGHAYAGLRGISRVEVSTDGGETWADATLSDPLPAVDGDGAAEDAWRQWVYAYDPPSGGHTAVVRMVDGEGTVQTAEETNPVPSGPSGWVSREFA
ncbi:molybdopterin-dependent oxidoreductase [Halomicroarcula sp. S1AR25-4]|uniref:molybdopterin-dependent oxidoreductase n=1 Tax=Haloarcula sp. S1AR25-4 TaxID=2950538 RepID=UPI0028759FA6|nr:molybdopterin-dependent oxidoreductase [Halomicroarcula sp. S1AR25-4]MDS0278088.1 molybdopterin-dependent oxidoreductase [Halomicroarcula sp. S1AR25-4]